jgi:hypothetical protein
VSSRSVATAGLHATNYAAYDGCPSIRSAVGDYCSCTDWVDVPAGLTILAERGPPSDKNPARSEIPLPPDPRKLAFDRGFDGQAGRVQNHVFSDTGERSRWGVHPDRLVVGMVMVVVLKVRLARSGVRSTGQPAC